MITRDITLAELESALASVSQRYGSNITWNRTPEPLNRSGRDWRFTLRCVSSKGPGHAVNVGYRMGVLPKRRLVSACWHVHGEFFDALFDQNPLATVVARGRRIREGYNWEDFNVGSFMFPVMASEACDCGA